MAILWLGLFYLTLAKPLFSLPSSDNLTFTFFLIYLLINLFMLIKGFKNEDNFIFFQVLIVLGIFIVMGSLILLLSIF